MAVINSWKNSGNRGIICFATGGGKTLTAISIIRDHINQGKPVLVLVPSLLLQKQWQSEIESEIEDPTIILFGGGFSALRRESILREASTQGGNIILSTYQTAVSKSFLRSIKLNENLLIVCDEVHTAGQPEFNKFLQLNFSGPRLGLSATPERYGDLEGTSRIFEYFGEKLQPFFTIADAIKVGRLVPYEYDYETVSLTAIEFSEWLEITKRIGMAAAMAADKGNKQLLERLLQIRSNIVKEAENKIGYVVKILKANFQEGDRWLIYCNNQYQLKTVREALNGFGEKVYDYHIAMPGSKDETLQFFADNGGIMLAINCLDEGIDIPQINKAIIIASSTNPRQFIQRRGRVLRSYKDKYKAKIWDVLVTNPNGDLLAVSEAKRALIFAQTSESSMTKVKLANLIESTNIAELVIEIGDNEN